ncbi:inner membrane protein YeiH [Nautilia profundicola AmH]|uniref:Inner membrane protein YeiH n=1 Tax=Nautilia profundicola (strain ATCC BAA-1463 / DSM 18972 / AmH) TaxID=598659 RepID=B9L959_NAUPA|nr:inner membrane protein YeiH [Nautilia profundicola AmH]
MINTFDTFLLTMAMTALGMETTVEKFKNVGMKPIYLAFILFIWLIIGGYFIVKLALLFK